jgi:hypothetical protein
MHKERCNKFVNELEAELTRPIPKTYIILKHLNKEMRETDIIGKNGWLNHFVELWTQKDSSVLPKFKQLSQRQFHIRLI